MKKLKNFHDKKEHVIHIRNLKRALNHGLVLTKVHRVIKFNQKAWLKSYIDMNTELRKKAKNDFEKYFFKSTKNEVFEKNMENMRKHRDIKLVTNEEETNYLVLETNYYTTNVFSKSFSHRNKQNTNIHE